MLFWLNQLQSRRRKFSKQRMKDAVMEPDVRNVCLAGYLLAYTKQFV